MTPAVSLARRAECLSGVPAFADLPPDVLDELAALLEEERHPQGAIVVAEGGAGDRLYLIVEGRAEVWMAGVAGPVVLSTVEAGEVFGELALMSTSGLRQANVAALTPLLVLTLTQTAFADLLRRFPATRAAFAGVAERMAVVSFLKQASPFRRLDPAVARQLAARVERLPVPSGAVIVQQGERGDACYLLRSGQLQVVVQDEHAAERELATLGPGALFGEAALLTDAPRNATVRAAEPSEVLVLHRADFFHAMGTSPRVAGQVMELLHLRARPRRIAGIITQQRAAADGDTLTILKDPQRHRYYRLSAPGWFLWQQLDGRHTIRDLALSCFAAFRTFAPQVVADVVAGLAEAGFVEIGALVPEAAGALAQAPRRQRMLMMARRILEARLTIGDMDGRVTRFYRRGVHLLYTPLAQLLLGVVALAGIAAFASVSLRVGASTLLADRSQVLLLSVIPAFLLSGVVHEAGHAFTTKAFGYEVPRVGIGWYWFTPIAFVDTSDIWLAGRWPRIAVSLAGPYANVVLAGLASVVAWLLSDPFPVAALWLLALVSYAIALLNLNPLLEYDGYYVLMDWLERPNLRHHALAWLGKGLPAALRTRGSLKGHGTEFVYGVSSVCYVVLTSVLIVVFYRAAVESWMVQLLPEVVATSLALALAACIVVLGAAAVIGELRAVRS